MAKIRIKEIYRDKINTKFGEREFIKVVPEEDKVMDINGDEIDVGGRKLSGFRDKAGETDKWLKGMTIKVQVATVEKDGKEFINFRLPEGQSSIVAQPTEDSTTVEPDEDSW